MSFQDSNNTLKKVLSNQIKNYSKKYEFFDSDGEIDDKSVSVLSNYERYTENKKIKDVLKANKTQNSKFKSTKEIFCSFCQKSNRNKQTNKICGYFYGPFSKGKIKIKQHYTHLMCALWCDKIYIDSQNNLVNVFSEAQKSKLYICRYCNKNGACSKCCNCNARLHFQCGLGKCQYMYESYTLFCQQCIKNDEVIWDKTSKKIKVLQFEEEQVKFIQQEQKQKDNKQILMNQINIKQQQVIKQQKNYNKFNQIQINIKKYKIQKVQPRAVARLLARPQLILYIKQKIEQQ